MIDDNPTPDLPYEAKLAIEHLKKNYCQETKTGIRAVMKLIQMQKAFHPLSEDCSTCAFMLQVYEKTNKCHRNCPGIEYNEDLVICENCTKFIDVNGVKYDNVCFNCNSTQTAADDTEKYEEREQLFYDAHDLGRFIGKFSLFDIFNLED